MRIKLPGAPPVHVVASFAHWQRDATHHGPQSRPRLVALSLVKLGRDAWDPAFFGRRLWAYFRGGYAFYFDLIVDLRRKSRTTAI